MKKIVVKKTDVIKRLKKLFKDASEKAPNFDSMNDTQLLNRYITHGLLKYYHKECKHESYYGWTMSPKTYIDLIK